MPVWEEQQLGNFSHGYPPQMPFKAPLRAATHSALYLSLDDGGDQLVGRAENGKPPLCTTEALCMCICAPRTCCACPIISALCLPVGLSVSVPSSLLWPKANLAVLDPIRMHVWRW